MQMWMECGRGMPHAQSLTYKVKPVVVSKDKNSEKMSRVLELFHLLLQNVLYKATLRMAEQSSIYKIQYL